MSVEVKSGTYKIAGGLLRVVCTESSRGQAWGWWTIDAEKPFGLDVFSRSFRVENYWPEISGEAAVVHSRGRVGGREELSIDGIGPIVFNAELHRADSAGA